MSFNGKEIFYSPLANTILREFKTAVFYGAVDQTDFSGISEGIMVMDMLARDDKEGLKALRSLSREDRHKHVLSFSIDHEEEITRLTPEITDRIESAMAASVESEAEGKSHSQAPDSSQRSNSSP